jgi:hypothetical protein
MSTNFSVVPGRNHSAHGLDAVHRVVRLGPMDSQAGQSLPVAKILGVVNVLDLGHRGASVEHSGIHRLEDTADKDRHVGDDEIELLPKLAQAVKCKVGAGTAAVEE